MLQCYVCVCAFLSNHYFDIFCNVQPYQYTYIVYYYFGMIFFFVCGCAFPLIVPCASFHCINIIRQNACIRTVKVRLEFALYLRHVLMHDVVLGNDDENAANEKNPDEKYTLLL